MVKKQRYSCEYDGLVKNDGIILGDDGARLVGVWYELQEECTWEEAGESQKIVDLERVALEVFGEDEGIAGEDDDDNKGKSKERSDIDIISNIILESRMFFIVGIDEGGDKAAVASEHHTNHTYRDAHRLFEIDHNRIDCVVNDEHKESGTADYGVHDRQRQNELGDPHEQRCRRQDQGTDQYVLECRPILECDVWITHFAYHIVSHQTSDPANHRGFGHVDGLLVGIDPGQRPDDAAEEGENVWQNPIIIGRALARASSNHQIKVFRYHSLSPLSTFGPMNCCIIMAMCTPISSPI